MNSVISTYLRGSPTASVVSESVKHLTKVLESGPAGRLSPSLLEAFLLGDSGALQFVNRTASYDPQNVLHLLSLLQERGFLSSTNFSMEHWESLCHLLYELMQTRRDPQCWTYAVKFLSWSELLSLISTREKLLDGLCDILIPSYEFDKPSEASCDFLAQPLYSKLLELCFSNFLSTPSVSTLKIVVRLTTFGLLLVKLAPSTYLPVLDQLAKTIHEITRRSSMDELHSTGAVLLSFEEASKLSVAKTLGIILFVLPRAPCQLLTILKNLLVLFPRLAAKEERFQTILNILTQAMRFPASVTNTPPSALNDGEEKENNQRLVQPAIFALRTFVKLTDALAQCDLPTQTHANMMNQLFDLLRVFPTSLEHAEVRLRAWWHFICRLPGELLDEGFKRFISPFLANLLGRYLSISAPLGDPQLHRYKLSDGNAYEGNFEALELTQHVFNCLFQGANLDLKLLDHVPCLQADSDFLVHNSYPLVVALLHWMRLICGHAFARNSRFPTACLPAQPVDRIWTDCIRLVLESARNVLTSDEEKNCQQLGVIRSPSMGNRPARSTSLTVLEQVLCCTCHLLTPGCLGALDNRSSDMPVGSPDAPQSLSILESLTEFVLQYPVPSQNKTELLFEILLKTLELGGQWIRPDSKPELFGTDDRERILRRWCSLSIRLINLDPRLDMGDADAVPTHSRKGGEFLGLLRQLLSALLPDCVQLAAAKHSSTDFGSQDSTMSVFLGQVPTICYSPDALRVWSELADRLTRFIVIEQLICDGDSVMHPNLSTVQATILAPFWLAGSTPAPTLTAGADSESSGWDNDRVPSGFLSTKDELALAKRLAHLFVAFHQEACLLTTMAANAWIDQLGHALVTLISALPSQPAQHFNFNLLGRLLKCFAQNAERVHEGVIPNAAFNPFTWKVTQDHPFGQLTGLLMALKLCLLHSPWFACLPPPTGSQTSSPPVRNQPAKPSARFLTSPPTIPCVQRSGTFDESSCSSSQLTLEERIAATSYKVSCGLLDALEAVVILVRNHAQEPELLTILVETLLPAISRLTACCVQAEAILQAADTELDEPLLITQRRQQTKTALEDVFVSIWRTLGCSPVVLSESDTVSVVRSLSKRSQNVSNQKQPKLDPHLCSGLLQAGLTLCDAGPKSSVLKRPFVLWFVGFWNHLAETCPKQGRSWEVVRHSLTEHEETVRHILCPPSQQLSQSATGHKVPSSGRKLRGRGRRCSTDRQTDKLSGGSEENNTSVTDLKQEQTPPMQSTQTDDSPKSRRPRRGRLSLNRPSVLAQQQTTPVLKIEPQETLTRSAPGKLITARRGRRSMLAMSPQKRSPGILASVLGIQPGVNIMESKSTWSPAAGGGSPSPLPGGRPLIKRRLFMSPSEVPSKFSLAASGQRKRTSSDSEQHPGCKPKFKLESEMLPQPIDFEESAQFVFIPPAPDNARKRRRTLTSHQKERFEEQRKDYLPATYTELDVSQQSMGDSQSESQSQFSQVSWDQFRTKTTVDEPSEPVLSQNEPPVTETPSTTVEMGPPVSAFQTETQTQSECPPPKASSSPEQKSAVAASDLSVHSESRNPDTSSSAPTDQMVEIPKQDSLNIEETSTSKGPSTEERSLSTSPKPIDHSSSTTSSKTNSSPVLPPKKLPSPQTPPVNFPLSGLLHRVSPLMCGPSSSRAQRMLALGLQKAAEQTARQKHTDATPGTPERRLSPTASLQLLKTPAGAESPSGIMRSIASRKKSHRVSFAEQPVVYTFGSPTHEQSQVTPPRPPPVELKPPPSTETKVVIDLSCSKPSRPDVSTHASHEPAAPIFDVDLDNSQSTGQHSQTKPLNDESPPRVQHRQRKSNSPQRLIITPRSSLTNSPSRAHRKETKLDSRKSAFVKRRRLFMADSPESVVEPPATVVLHTQPEKLPSPSVVLSRPLVVDSEPIEIEDTQSSQTQVSVSSSPAVELPEATISETQDDVECIESSQGTQDSTQQPPSEPEQCKTESLEQHMSPHHAVSPAPAYTAEQDEPKNTTKDPLSIPQCGLYDNTDALTEPALNATTVAQSPESDAEQFIRQSLSQIAEKLSCLNPSQYSPLLMEALSTFKPLMR
ncbi:hypothetical protein CSKR_113211 [Clonorchis sinensis]|uniref:Uncharacterized protein n=1 Tax=Clonorchis sinensis TaxID=79923 RepID=A0A8T1MXL8_CLOSI|nr:hypothetical protein CSKR_113211 [Clonorchis sinensis]